MARLFSPHGRVNRSTYLALGLGISAIYWFAATVDFRYGLIAALILVWPSVATSVKRFHDFGQSGWSVIATFIPLVNVVAGLVLLFKPGTEGANKYGDSPIAGIAP